MSTRDLSKSNAFLIDATKCTGCRGCQVSCKQWNQLDAEHTEFFGGEGYENPPKMTDRTFTKIRFCDYEGSDGNTFGFAKEMCFHCNDPACASVCPVGAFKKTEEGPVIYEADKCIGCRFCMVACPFGVPKYEWGKQLPLVKKCTGCHSRVKEGLKPACATACMSAISYGPRDEMVKEAERRLAAHPDRYVNKVYGKNDAGGTGVLYITSVPFEKLGFKKVTMQALPSYTWQALRFVPGIFLGVGGTLSALAWLNHRKTKLAAENSAENSADKAIETKEDQQ